MNEPSKPPPSPALHSLGGQSAPPQILADLEQIVWLPPAAQDRFWDALGPALSDPVPAGIGDVLDTFCGAHGVSAETLGRAVRASRFLVREASRRSLARELFAQDLAAIRPGDHTLASVLLRGFEAARAHVRQELAARSIMAHGKLLLDVEWRLDSVTSSNHGASLRTPVAFLTLRYEENGKQETITLQALPNVLQKLEAACRQLRG
ncbi:MAG: hypothetical protein QM820_46840 [Minicystis sp.]